MKRDDIIAGIIGGTIFVTGCTVGIFGYQKMTEPVFSRTPIEDSDRSISQIPDNDIEYTYEIDQDRSVYEEADESSTNVDADETANSDDTVTFEEDENTYQETIDQLSKNTIFSVETSDDNAGDDYNFNKYDNEEQQETSETYVLNTSTFKIHHPTCNDVKKISPDNYATSSETIEELRAQGYSQCGHCFK